MASIKGTGRWIWHLIWMGLWLLVVLAVAFFVLYLLQNKQPFGIVQRGATALANAAKGSEVSAS